MEVLLLKAFGIVELMNVSGDPHQNAAWAASDMLRETMDLRDALQTQLREIRAEADHD